MHRWGSPCFHRRTPIQHLRCPNGALRMMPQEYSSASAPSILSLLYLAVQTPSRTGHVTKESKYGATQGLSWFLQREAQGDEAGTRQFCRLLLCGLRHRWAFSQRPTTRTHYQSWITLRSCHNAIPTPTESCEERRTRFDSSQFGPKNVLLRIHRAVDAQETPLLTPDSTSWPLTSAS
jgi:hypothetical protein